MYFAFDISWPCKQSAQTDYFEKNWVLSKNKNLEIQISKFRHEFTILGLSLQFMPYGRDHAGAKFEVVVLGYTVIVNFYDKRHWDYDNNKWEEYQETEDKIHGRSLETNKWVKL